MAFLMAIIGQYYTELGMNEDLIMDIELDIPLD